MHKKITNIVVVGQGAIGLLWYHHLSQVSSVQNTKVNLLASNHKTLTDQGITEASYQFTPYLHKAKQTFALNYAQSGDIEKADVMLLCLKSFKVAEAVASLSQHISAKTVIILAHNGMGTAEKVTALLPRNQVILAMLTTHGCLRNAPLDITHTGLGKTDIGLLCGYFSDAQQQQITQQLSALADVTFHQDIFSKQWLKLAINCVINPITAINDIDNGLVNSEEYTVRIQAILTEVIQVGKAEGVLLALATLTENVTLVARATAKNCSSMRSDILANKPTEIDFINGYIHRLGEKHHIATPENTQLWQQVKALNYTI